MPPSGRARAAPRARRAYARARASPTPGARAAPGAYPTGARAACGPRAAGRCRISQVQGERARVMEIGPARRVPQTPVRKLAALFLHHCGEADLQRPRLADAQTPAEERGTRRLRAAAHPVAAECKYGPFAGWRE